MKVNLFLILTLILFTSKSNSQKSLEVGDCLFEQLGYKMFSTIWELLEIIFSFDEEKIYAYAYSHPEILYATSYCMTKPDMVLRYEAEKIIKNFFGISYKVSEVIFDKEFIIYEGCPKITMKFKNNCDMDLISSNFSYIHIEGETVISQKGMETTFSNTIVKQILDQTGFDIEKMSQKFQKTLEGAIADGTVYFQVYLDKIEIGIIIDQKINEKVTCSGSIIITIEAGNCPPPSPAPAPIIDNEALNHALILASECGTIALGTVTIICLSQAAFMGTLPAIAAYLLGLV